MSEQAKLPNAQNAPDAPTLPFGGKFAAALLLLVAVVTATAIGFLLRDERCGGWVGRLSDRLSGAVCNENALPIILFTFVGVLVALVGAAVIVWLVCRGYTAVRSFREWWKTFPGVGKFAAVVLAAVIVFELVVRYLYKDYDDSPFGKTANKITDKIMWFSVMGIVLAWRWKQITEWVRDKMQVRGWFGIGKTEVKEAVKSAPVESPPADIVDAPQKPKLNWRERLRARFSRRKQQQDVNGVNETAEVQGAENKKQSKGLSTIRSWLGRIRIRRK